MTAKRHRRKGRGARAPASGSPTPVPDFAAQPAARPASPSVLVGEDPASRGLCPLQGQGDARSRDGELRAQPARRRSARTSCSQLVERAQRRSSGRRHPRPAAAAGADRRDAGDRRDRPGQGRRRLPSDQCRPARDRPATRWSLHAARLPDAAQAASSATSPGSTRSWSAAPTSSASRWRSCCFGESCTVTVAHSPHPRPARRRPPRRHRRRRGRPARDGPRRLAEAGRDRDRRRHQPRRPADGKRKLRRRRRFRRGASRSPARSRRSRAASAR